MEGVMRVIRWWVGPALVLRVYSYSIIPFAVVSSPCRFRKEGLDLIYLYSVLLSNTRVYRGGVKQASYGHLINTLRFQPC